MAGCVGSRSRLRDKSERVVETRHGAVSARRVRECPSVLGPPEGAGPGGSPGVRSGSAPSGAPGPRRGPGAGAVRPVGGAKQTAGRSGSPGGAAT